MANPPSTFTRVIVCGSRDGIYLGTVERALDEWDRAHGKIEHLIVGSEQGVDWAAYQWAKKRERMRTVVPAQWETGGRGKAEGPIRNRRMPDKFSVHAVLSFPGGPGTEDMKKVAREQRIPLWICSLHGDQKHFDWLREGE